MSIAETTTSSSKATASSIWSVISSGTVSGSHPSTEMLFEIRLIVVLVWTLTNTGQLSKVSPDRTCKPWTTTTSRTSRTITLSYQLKRSFPGQVPRRSSEDQYFNGVQERSFVIVDFDVGSFISCWVLMPCNWCQVKIEKRQSLQKTWRSQMFRQQPCQEYIPIDWYSAQDSFNILRSL